MDKDNKNSKTIDFNSIDREKREKKLNESMTVNIYEGKKKTTNDGKIIEFEQAKKEQKTKARKQKIKNAAPKGRSGYIKNILRCTTYTDSIYSILKTNLTLQ